MVAPCAEHQTMADELEHVAHVSWRYYGSDAGNWPTSTKDGIATRPNSIAHICGPIVNGQCTGPEWTANVIFSPSQVLTDISTNCNLDRLFLGDAGQLRSTIILGRWQTRKGRPGLPRSSTRSETAHARTPTAVLTGTPTAILITWDDWGGWVNHVSSGPDRTARRRAAIRWASASR